MEDFFFLSQFLKILVDFSPLLWFGAALYQTYLISVYSCAGLSLSGPKRREKKQEKDSHVNYSQIEELSAGKSPFELTRFFIALCCIKMCWMF